MHVFTFEKYIQKQHHSQTLQPFCTLFWSKQSKLDFNKAKDIFVCIQFMVIYFGKSRFSDNKLDNLE